MFLTLETLYLGNKIVKQRSSSVSAEKVKKTTEPKGSCQRPDISPRPLGRGTRIITGRATEVEGMGVERRGTKTRSSV